MLYFCFDFFLLQKCISACYKMCMLRVVYSGGGEVCDECSIHLPAEKLEPVNTLFNEQHIGKMENNQILSDGRR